MGALQPRFGTERNPMFLARLGAFCWDNQNVILDFVFDLILDCVVYLLIDLVFNFLFNVFVDLFIDVVFISETEH